MIPTAGISGISRPSRRDPVPAGIPMGPRDPARNTLEIHPLTQKSIGTIGESQDWEAPHRGNMDRTTSAGPQSRIS
jgi:hypothetical protein